MKYHDCKCRCHIEHTMAANCCKCRQLPSPPADELYWVPGMKETMESGGITFVRRYRHPYPTMPGSGYRPIGVERKRNAS